MKTFFIFLLFRVTFAIPLDHCGVQYVCDDCNTIPSCTWIITNKVLGLCIDSNRVRLVNAVLTFSHGNCKMYDTIEAKLSASYSSHKSGNVEDVKPNSSLHIPTAPPNYTEINKMEIMHEDDYSNTSSKLKANYTEMVIPSDDIINNNPVVREFTFPLKEVKGQLPNSDPTTLTPNYAEFNKAQLTKVEDLTHISSSNTPGIPLINGENETQVVLPSQPTPFNTTIMKEFTSSLKGTKEQVLHSHTAPSTPSFQSNNETQPDAVVEIVLDLETSIVTPTKPQSFFPSTKPLHLNNTKLCKQDNLNVDKDFLGDSPVGITDTICSSNQIQSGLKKLENSKTLKKLKEPLNDRMRRAFCNSYKLATRYQNKFPINIPPAFAAWNRNNPMRSQLLECERLLYRKVKFYS